LPGGAFSVFYTVLIYSCLEHASARLGEAVQDDGGSIFLIGHSGFCLASRTLLDETRFQFVLPDGS